MDEAETPQSVGVSESIEEILMCVKHVFGPQEEEHAMPQATVTCPQSPHQL